MTRKVHHPPANSPASRSTVEPRMAAGKSCGGWEPAGEIRVQSTRKRQVSARSATTSPATSRVPTLGEPPSVETCLVQDLEFIPPPFQVGFTVLLTSNRFIGHQYPSGHVDQVFTGRTTEAALELLSLDAWKSKVLVPRLTAARGNTRDAPPPGHLTSLSFFSCTQVLPAVAPWAGFPSRYAKVFIKA